MTWLRAVLGQLILSQLNTVKYRLRAVDVDVDSFNAKWGDLTMLNTEDS